MKKLIALVLILVFSITVFAGCGKGSAEEVKLEYFSVSLVDGWHISYRSADSSYELENEKYPDANVNVAINAVRPPDEILPSIIAKFDGNKQIDNVTIKGLEYFVVVNEEKGTTYLVESKKGANAIAVFTITIFSTDLKTVTPLIETLKMNTEVLELDDEEMEKKYND